MERKRSENYNREELDTLLTCLEKKPNLLKFDSGVTRNRAFWDSYRKEWGEIASEINKLGFRVLHSGDDVKNKWLDLKCRTRKKEKLIRKESSKWCGQKKLTEIEKRVLTLIRSINEDNAALDNASEHTGLMPDSCARMMENVITLPSSGFVSSDYGVNLPSALADEHHKEKETQPDSDEEDISKLVETQYKMLQEVKE
ncbi:hypothetical protein X975_15831, partial [Stegodyphus mimosarum]